MCPWRVWACLWALGAPLRCSGTACAAHLVCRGAAAFLLRALLAAGPMVGPRVRVLAGVILVERGRARRAKTAVQILENCTATEENCNAVVMQILVHFLWMSTPHLRNFAHIVLYEEKSSNQKLQCNNKKTALQRLFIFCATVAHCHRKAAVQFSSRTP